MIRNHPWRSLLLLVLLSALAWTWAERRELQAFPGILSAYSAKEFCSCRYVMEQSDGYCRSYVKQYLPLSELRDDPARARVVARGLGQTRTAVWIGPRQGCRLISGG
ncbi:MAG: amidase [Pseudomonas sp.]|uniref:amidase n=1 Tax=Pseudomonas abieticivorans TaxID=2931382 RepID=UPI0020BF9016|nr:amidase [Pseudomonas sp. PIA16]MDE1163916.1 amidase [Pseudomonas sp.]